MRSIIKKWEYKLVNVNENLEIHKQASTNKEFTADMRDYARSRALALTEYKKLIEDTIEGLERVCE